MNGMSLWTQIIGFAVVAGIVQGLSFLIAIAKRQRAERAALVAKTRV